MFCIITRKNWKSINDHLVSTTIIKLKNYQQDKLKRYKIYRNEQENIV
jgi:hypothetical protein